MRFDDLDRKRARKGLAVPAEAPPLKEEPGDGRGAAGSAGIPEAFSVASTAGDTEARARDKTPKRDWRTFM